MATIELINTFKSLSNKPTSSRQMEYVIQRIEDEITKRMKRAIRKVVRK